MIFKSFLFPFRAFLVSLGIFFLAIPSGQAQTARLPVVVSFSILADVVKQVGGERIDVYSLVKEDSDAHAYQPTPQDGKYVRQAKLVVINGLGFESFIERLVKSSGYRGSVVVASQGIQALESQESHGHRHKHEETHDPHAWQDPQNVMRYVDNIRQGLIAVDPEGQAYYTENAERYKEALHKLHLEIKTRFSTLPKERRNVLSTHDAFAYFGRAYDIKFIFLAGAKFNTDLSAGDISRVIRRVRDQKITAVFIENMGDARVMERIQKESGAKMGGMLYSDALSKKNAAASSYIEMIRYNATTLFEALQ